MGDLEPVLMGDPLEWDPSLHQHLEWRGRLKAPPPPISIPSHGPSRTNPPASIIPINYSHRCKIFPSCNISFHCNNLHTLLHVLQPEAVTRHGSPSSLWQRFKQEIKSHLKFYFSELSVPSIINLMDTF